MLIVDLFDSRSHGSLEIPFTAPLNPINLYSVQCTPTCVRLGPKLWLKEDSCIFIPIVLDNPFKDWFSLLAPRS